MRDVWVVFLVPDLPLLKQLLELKLNNMLLIKLFTYSPLSCQDPFHQPARHLWGKQRQQRSRDFRRLFSQLGQK